MQQRILILGKSGMLGHMVEHVLAADGRFTVRGTTREEFDIAQCESGARGKTSGVEAGGRTPEVEEARSAGKTSGVEDPASILRSARPLLDALLTDADYVINCIGITARHINDSDPTSIARAIRVNAEFPHVLAAAAAERGARVIHMSTDGVFSGTKSFSPSHGEGERPVPARASGEGVGEMTPFAYAETDTPDATDTYGRSKALGESAALNVLNIRCSIVGPSPVKREGLWEWVLAQPDGATVDGYTNHLWHGVTTLQFAEFCKRILVDQLSGARGKTSGVEKEPKATGKHLMLKSARHSTFEMLRAGSHVLHFAPNAPVTKTELVEHIAKALGKRISVRPVAHAQPVRRVLAMRPDISAMFGAAQPIAEALRACVTACA